MNVLWLKRLHDVLPGHFVNCSKSKKFLRAKTANLEFFDLAPTAKLRFMRLWTEHDVLNATGGDWGTTTVDFIFTACKRSLGQGNIFAPVCHSVHGGCVCHYSPLVRHPPGRHLPLQENTHPSPPSRHPPGHTPPPPSSACWDTVNKRAVRIPLECILVFVNDLVFFSTEGAQHATDRVVHFYGKYIGAKKWTF